MHDAFLMQVGDSFQEVYHDDLCLLDGGEAEFLEIAVEGQRIQFEYYIG